MKVIKKQVITSLRNSGKQKYSVSKIKTLREDSLDFPIPEHIKEMQTMTPESLKAKVEEELNVEFNITPQIEEEMKDLRNSLKEDQFFNSLTEEEKTEWIEIEVLKAYAPIKLINYEGKHVDSIMSKLRIAKIAELRQIEKFYADKNPDPEKDLDDYYELVEARRDIRRILWEHEKELNPNKYANKVPKPKYNEQENEEGHKKEHHEDEEEHEEYVCFDGPGGVRPTQWQLFKYFGVILGGPILYTLMLYEHYVGPKRRATLELENQVSLLLMF